MSDDILPPQLDVLRPIPAFVEPGESVLLTFRITSCDVELDISSARLHWSVDAGTEQTALLTALPDGYYSTEMIVSECGDEVAYYISVESTGGQIYTLPEGAPGTSFKAELGTLAPIFEDGFESDLGWTSGAAVGDTATTGGWERAAPEATTDTWNEPLQPGSAFAGSACYVTGATQGGSFFANDVDGGTTYLVSPSIDMSAFDKVRIQYQRWFVNDGGPGPHTDPFTVEISSDGGSIWVTAESVEQNAYEASGLWYGATLVVEDLITLTSDVRVRFVATDGNPGSIVEALVDEFTVSELVCIPPVLVCDGDANNDQVVDVNDISYILFRLGNNGKPGSVEGDANNDGVVDVNDISYVLFRLGVCS